MKKEFQMRYAVTLSLVVFFTLCPGFSSIAEASDQVTKLLEQLRSDPGVQFTENDGWLLAYRGHRLWVFTPETHAAYPAAIERHVYEADGTIKIGTRLLCNKSEEVCGKLRQDYRELDLLIRDRVRRASEPRIIENPAYKLTYSPADGWNIAEYSYGALVLKRFEDNGKTSHVGSVRLYKLPAYASGTEFLEDVIAQRRESFSNDPRTDTIHMSEELSEFRGATCVRMTYSYLDHGAVLPDGRKQTQPIRSIGYRCLHPYNETLGVHAGYSIRYSGELDEEKFKGAATDFLGGIEFTPFEFQ